MELVELIDHSFLIFENALQDLKLVLDVFDLFERDDVVRNTEWITSGLRRFASLCSFVLVGLSAQPLRNELLLESRDLRSRDLSDGIVEVSPAGSFLIYLKTVSMNKPLATADSTY
jgi:hypothetical protein